MGCAGMTRWVALAAFLALLCPALALPLSGRHTYALTMLSAGEHPMWVAKQMGHADWTMIARVYGRWMPSADAEAGSRAVEKFAGNAGKFAGKADVKLAKSGWIFANLKI